MYYRQKVLMALLQALGGHSNGLDFQKYLFLFTRLQNVPVYDFVPYKFGCFSFQSYSDRRAMVKNEILKDAQGWTLHEAYDYVSTISDSDLAVLKQFKKNYTNIHGNKLIKLVYTKYPYYAINSEIIDSILSKSEINKVEESRVTDNRQVLFTIGYEGKSIDKYLNKIIQNNIRVVCDVRKNPLSRKYGFSKNQMKDTLEKLGIRYMHLPQLGVASEQRKFLHSPEDYRILFDKYNQEVIPNSYKFLKIIENLLNQYQRVALTCFESDPSFCHRNCVAEALNNFVGWSRNLAHI